MPDHGGNLVPTHGIHQRQRVLNQIERARRGYVAVIAVIPPTGTPVTTLVRRDDMVARLCQRQHHFAPAVGQLREAVQQ